MSGSNGRSFELSGLLEGRVPPTPDFPERLERFARDAAEAGLHGTLEIDGGRFGFLGDGRARKLPAVGHAPGEQLDALLTELLRAFPDGDRRQLFSTLRSTERDGAARVRTLFALRPDGGVERVAERDVDAAPDSTPATRRQALQLAALALFLVLAAGFTFDAFGVRGALAGVLGGAARFDALASEDWGGVLSVESLTVGGSPPSIELELARGPLFPGETREDLLASPLPEGMGHAELLSRLALARGEGRLVFQDRAGRVLHVAPVPLNALFREAVVLVEVPWPAVRGVSRVDFSW